MALSRHFNYSHYLTAAVAGVLAMSLLLVPNALQSRSALQSRERVSRVEFSENVAKAIALLRKETSFTDGALGEYDGPLPPVAAMQSLLREPSAVADSAFKHLLSDPDATITGQLYALCGLYFTDSVYFRRAIVDYRTRTGQVRWHSGCTVRKVGIATIIGSDTTKDICIANGEIPRSIWKSWNYNDSGEHWTR